MTVIILYVKKPDIVKTVIKIKMFQVATLQLLENIVCI